MVKSLILAGERVQPIGECLFGLRWEILARTCPSKTWTWLGYNVVVAAVRREVPTVPVLREWAWLSRV